MVHVTVEGPGQAGPNGGERGAQQPFCIVSGFPQASMGSQAESSLAEVKAKEIDTIYPTVVQFDAIRELLQDKDFARECAEIAHNTYCREIEKLPDHEIPPLFKPGASKEEIDRTIAQNLAPLYALDGAMTELWRSDRYPPIESLRKYLLAERSPLGLSLQGVFANNGWKAGQPFRDLDRIEREVFKPAVFLDQQELDKDHLLTRAVGMHLLEGVRARLENTYPPEEQQELFERIEQVLKTVSEKVSVAGKRLTAPQIEAMRQTARETMYAHRHQRRKTGEPYFQHQLDVVETLVDAFQIEDPRLIHVAFRHDTREDQLMHYRNQKSYRLNKLSRDEATPGGDPLDVIRRRKDLWHEALAVRMLSKLEGEKYDHLSREESLRQTYERLSNPREYYNSLHRPPYSDQWIRGVQQVKLADILSNLNDLSQVVSPKANYVSGEAEPGFPVRFVGKILDFAVPGFVNRSEYLTDGDLRTFYQQAEQILAGYINQERTPFNGSFQEALIGPDGLMVRLEQLKRNGLSRQS